MASPPTLAARIEALRIRIAEFDESKHRRDDDGKFAEKEGSGGPGTTRTEPPPPDAEAPKKISFEKDGRRDDYRVMEYPDGFAPDQKNVEKFYNFYMGILDGTADLGGLHADHAETVGGGGIEAVSREVGRPVTYAGVGDAGPPDTTGAFYPGNYRREILGHFTKKNIRDDPGFFKRMDERVIETVGAHELSKERFVESEEKLAAINRIQDEQFEKAGFFYRDISLDELDTLKKKKFRRSKHYIKGRAEYTCASLNPEISASGLEATMKIPAGPVRARSAPAHYTMFERGGGNGRLYCPEHANAVDQMEVRIREGTPIPPDTEIHVHVSHLDGAEASERRRGAVDKYGDKWNLKFA